VQFFIKFSDNCIEIGIDKAKGFVCSYITIEPISIGLYRGRLDCNITAYSHFHSTLTHVYPSHPSPQSSIHFHSIISTLSPTFRSILHMPVWCCMMNFLSVNDSKIDTISYSKLTDLKIYCTISKKKILTLSLKYSNERQQR